MSLKTLVWIGLTIGSLIGGYIPVLFGSSIFSLASIVGNAIGGLAGIYAAYKINQMI
jgi:hypothetical protein